MADFDSSDIDFSEHEDVSSRVGMKAIASMTKHADVDRIESKKKSKKLLDAANAPSTAWHRGYWPTLFEHFAMHTLQIDKRPNTTPTGDDIVRFLSQLPRHLQPRREDGKIAWTTIRDARVHVERGLTFHHEDFKLSKRDNLRLDPIIQTLFNDGEITKDPIREALWLSCQIVKRMVAAVLSNAIVEGTKSWDTTLAGCLGLLLQAALASRAGDIKIFLLCCQSLFIVLSKLAH